MGKIKTRLLGLEDVEEKQKKEQKEKSRQKKSAGTKALRRREAMKDKSKVREVIKDSAVAEDKAGKEKKPTSAKKAKVRTKSRGKAYQKAKKEINQTKKYLITEAIKILKKIKFSRIDESVELHLNVDKTGLKGEVELPYSTGKTIRVKIVDDKLLVDIEKGKIEFDILITHPSYMPKLAKFAKILGPKGLMPNPKAGTISQKPEETAKKFEKGMLYWKTESKFPLIHQMIGKLASEDKELIENANKFILSVGKAHILSVFIKSTMSPSIKLDLEKS